MAYGLERRQETQPLAQPSTRQAQVQGPGVGGPSGSAPQVDTSMVQALGELSRFGGSAINDLIERKRKESFLEGQAMYAQGKTLVDLEKSGENYYTTHGWQTMEAQNAGALWAAGEKQKITDNAYQIDPEEYRKGMASSVVELTKGRDAESTAMVMEIANKYIPELASAHMAANASYKKTKTLNAAMDSFSALSASDVDKQSFLDTLSPDKGGALSNLSPEDYNKTVVGGIMKAFENDSPNAYKWAEESGMLTKLDASSLATLRQGQANYQTRQEQKLNENYLLGHSRIIEDQAAGKISLPEALEQEKALKDQYGYKFDNQDASTFLSVENSRNAQQRSDARADAKQAEAEAKNQQYALAYQQYAVASIPLRQALHDGTITPQQFLDQNTDLIKSYGLPFTAANAGDAVSSIFQAEADRQTQQAKQFVVDDAISKNSYSNLTPTQQQQAVDTQRQAIFGGMQNAIAEGRVDEKTAQADAQAKWITWLDQSGLTDGQTSGVFSRFLRSNLVDSKGQIAPEAEIAFAQFMDMYKQNPRLAMRHVEGADAQARVRMLMGYYQDEGNYGGALQNVAIVESNMRQTGADPSKRLENPAIVSDINKSVDKFIDDNTIDFASVVFGNDTWSQWWKTTDESIQRAGEGFKPVAEDYMKRQMGLLIAKNPSLDMKSAQEQAASMMQERTVYLGGQFYIQPTGSNIYDKMFGKGGVAKYGRNPAIPNEAVYDYIAKYGKQLFGEEVTGALGVYNPEINVSWSPDGNGLLVQVRRPQSPLDKALDRTQTWTGAKPIPFRDLGIMYETKLKTGIKSDLDMQEQARKAAAMGQPTPQQQGASQ
jgi:hypothetical protein